MNIKGFLFLEQEHSFDFFVEKFPTKGNQLFYIEEGEGEKKRVKRKTLRSLMENGNFGKISPEKCLMAHELLDHFYKTKFIINKIREDCSVIRRFRRQLTIFMEMSGKVNFPS